MKRPSGAARTPARYPTRPSLATPIRRRDVNTRPEPAAPPVRAIDVPTPFAWRKTPVLPSSRTAVKAIWPWAPYETPAVNSANVPPPGAGWPVAAMVSTAAPHRRRMRLPPPLRNARTATQSPGPSAGGLTPATVLPSASVSPADTTSTRPESVRRNVPVELPMKTTRPSAIMARLLKPENGSPSGEAAPVVTTGTATPCDGAAASVSSRATRRRGDTGKTYEANLVPANPEAAREVLRPYARLSCGDRASTHDQRGPPDRSR